MNSPNVAVELVPDLVEVRQSDKGVMVRYCGSVIRHCDGSVEVIIFTDTTTAEQDLLKEWGYRVADGYTTGIPIEDGPYPGTLAAHLDQPVVISC